MANVNVLLISKVFTYQSQNHNARYNEQFHFFKMELYKSQMKPNENMNNRSYM